MYDFAEFKEKETRTLSKGMLADIAVLSQAIFTIQTELQPATQSVLTMVDGKIVYQQTNAMNKKKEIAYARHVVFVQVRWDVGIFAERKEMATII